MKGRPLRGPEGLRPYAAVKSLGPSALADGGYPLSRDFQRVTEPTPLSAHDEIEDIAADTTAKTMENLPLRVNVEGWVTLSVKRTEANVLLTGALQPGVCPSDADEVASQPNGLRIELR